MNKILREICEANLLIDCHEPLLPTKDLSRRTGFSRKEVLKEIKTLKAKGLVEYVRTIEQGWDEPFFNQGWSITQKALSTSEYEAALDAETAWFMHFYCEGAEEDPWSYAKSFMATRKIIDWRKE